MFDNHVHCHEFPPDELETYRQEGSRVCVSDDLARRKKTLELGGAVQCLGIHPWQVDKAEPGDLPAVLKLIEKSEAPCVGEVGLDKRFVPHSFDKQKEFFKEFLKLDRELDLVVNVHAPDAWGDVLEELRRSDVDRAVIHWYTGPLHLLEEVSGLGYFITINPAVVVQKKHQEVAVAADRRILLLESDGPYEYRGMRLAPPLIEKTVEKLAELWKSPRDYVVEVVEENAKRLWRRA